jgi:hypothetical protein
MVTVAPGTMAPLLSTTVPLILPVVELWAKTEFWHITHSTRIVPRRQSLLSSDRIIDSTVVIIAFIFTGLRFGF